MGKSLPSLAGDGAPMKKMLAFFSWVPGKVAEGRKGEYKTVFVPLGAVYRMLTAASTSSCVSVWPSCAFTTMLLW